MLPARAPGAGSRRGLPAGACRARDGVVPVPTPPTPEVDESTPGKGGGSANPDDPVAGRDQFISTTLGHLPDDALVINVGCGVVRRFEPVCHSRYMATDLRMLPSVDFASDASALPVADKSVDMVLSLELLEHVPDPTAVLREIARILKPGGTAMVSVPSAVPPRRQRLLGVHGSGPRSPGFDRVRARPGARVRRNFRGARLPGRVLHGADLPCPASAESPFPEGVPRGGLLARPP